GSHPRPRPLRARATPRPLTRCRRANRDDRPRGCTRAHRNARMTLLIIGNLFAGLALLVLGAESLVRGAAQLARRMGISPLVIGLTVVAFGTSAPEAAVSIKASLSGSGDIAVGNVIGSNIANILLI